MRFIEELRRRSVFRVAGLYAVVGWLIAQMAIALETSLGLPGWFDAVIVSAVLIGFPIALVLAWALELTPDGLKRTDKEPGSDDAPVPVFRKTDIAILGGLAVVGALMIAGWLGKGAATDLPVSAERTERKATYASIAVLPFADMSAARDQEYFSDGIAEELLNALASSPDLKVAARTSSFSFKGKDTPVRDIAAALNVETVLEGSVRKSGDKLRITAQLIDAETGYHLWSEIYDRDMDDIFAVQDELANAIVRQLNKTLSGIEADPRPKSPEAYEAYLLGRKYEAERTTTGFTKADAAYREAISLDPDFADAYARLANVYFWIETWGLPGSEDGKARAERYRLVKEALRRDPENENGLYLDSTRREQEGEEGAFFRYTKERYTAHPNDPDAQYGFALSTYFRGSYSEALDLIEKALVRDPLNVSYLILRANLLTDTGHAREAIDEMEPLLGFFDTNRVFVSTFSWAHGELGDCRKSFEVDLAALERTSDDGLSRNLMGYNLLFLEFPDLFAAISSEPETDFMVRMFVGETISLAEIEAAKSNLAATTLSWLYMQAGDWPAARASTETARLNYAYLVTANETVDLADLLLIVRKLGDKTKAREIETELGRRLAILKSEGATDSSYYRLVVSMAAARGDTKALAKALQDYEKQPFCRLIHFWEPVFDDVRADPAVIAFDKRQDARIAARRKEFIDAGLIDRVRAVIAKTKAADSGSASGD